MHKTGYNEQMQALVAKYRQAGQPWPATTREIAAWLVRTNQWEPSRELAIEQCADDLARAMREEFITDRQGRRVRAKHAARREVNGEQQTFWADLRTAPREHMENIVVAEMTAKENECPVNGEWLLRAGLAPGPQLGKLLSRFQAEWQRLSPPRDRAGFLERAIASLERDRPIS